jgi:tetratricopeptide (TPR) repeat protein
MRILRRFCAGLLTVFSVALLVGCAAVGVISSDDPDTKLSDAGHLLDQGRPLPAQRLIDEAIAIYRERDDPHGLGHAYSQYAELLQSNAIDRAAVSFMRNGFRDKSITLSNRFDKSVEYIRMAVAQYELAIARHRHAEKYDALTNAHLHLAWMHQMLMQKDAACANFQKTLDAYGLNVERNPQAKPHRPRSGQSIPDYVRGLMRKAQCANAP